MTFLQLTDIYFILFFLIKIVSIMPGTVAQACNPSYFGGRDQEDHSTRRAQAK
jgi:hypothetical protein